MLFGSSGQIYVFLAFLYVGIICAVVYEIFALFRHNKITTIITDILFSLVCIVLILWCAQRFNYGQIRAYMVIAFVLGLNLGLKTVGKYVAKLLNLIYNKILTGVKLFIAKHLKRKKEQDDSK